MIVAQVSGAPAALRLRPAYREQCRGCQCTEDDRLLCQRVLGWLLHVDQSQHTCGPCLGLQHMYMLALQHAGNTWQMLQLFVTDITSPRYAGSSFLGKHEAVLHLVHETVCPAIIEQQRQSQTWGLGLALATSAKRTLVDTSPPNLLFMLAISSAS